MTVTDEQAHWYTKWLLTGSLWVAALLPLTLLIIKINMVSNLECGGVVVASGENMGYSEGSWKFTGGSYTPKLGEVCFRKEQ